MQSLHSPPYVRDYTRDVSLPTSSVYPALGLGTDRWYTIQRGPYTHRDCLHPTRWHVTAQRWLDHPCHSLHVLCRGIPRLLCWWGF
jgi:hypothetical protein